MPLLTPAELPINQYHNSVPEYLSKTSIKNFIECGPAWWRKAYLDKSIEIKRPAGALQGSALDCYLTEGSQAFYKQYAIKPEGLSIATKEGRAWKELHGEMDILSHDDHEILGDAVRAVQALPCWPEIERAKAQMTARRYSDSLNLGIQSRPDWIDLERGIIWDLKKTSDLSRFGKQAIDLGYHLQAAIAGWCLAGDNIAINKCNLVAVEWEHGARARVYEIPHSVLEFAEQEMRKAAAQIAWRLQHNNWVDVQDDTEALEVPEWMLRKMGIA